MILRTTTSQNLAIQSNIVSESLDFASQIIHMKSRKCKMPRLCMQRGEPNESTDQYYQQMIKDNPGNALLLGNYAKFLKEVKCDFYKAEEYCKRAIQTKDEDGDIHSLYGELIWLIDNDITRAEAHFHQAVLAQPSDSYVHASYARFLWEVEEKDEDS